MRQRPNEQERLIQRYPHPGLRIAPKTLGPILEASNPVPLSPLLAPRYSQLSQLDETAWHYLTAQECYRCADAVLRHVARQRYSPLLRHIRFPRVTAGLTAESLNVHVRTYNCIRHAFHLNMISSLADLRNFTVGEFLHSVGGFGTNSLVDLLVVLESECDGLSVREIEQDVSSTTGTTDSPLEWEDIADLLRNPRMLPQSLGRRLPVIPSGVSLLDLQLSPRGQSCLRRLLENGTIKSLPDLSNLALRDLLKNKNFGRESLLALLEALAPDVIAAPGFPSATREADPLSSAVTRAAERLRDLRTAERIRCNDLRLRDSLRPLLAFANALSDDPPLQPPSTLYFVAHRLVGRTRDAASDEVLGIMKRVRSALSRTMRLTVEGELEQIVSLLTSTRNTLMVLRYFGWDCKGGCTLQKVGEEFGITRERVRQIVTPIESTLRRAKPFLPALDGAIRWIERRVPIAEIDAARKLRRSSVLSTPFRINGLLSAAEIFGTPLTFTLDERSGIRTLVQSGQIGLSRRIEKIARHAVSSLGLAAVADVCNQLCEAAGYLPSTSTGKELLRQSPGYRSLAPDNAWFWFDDLPRNHLRTRLLKVLSISARIHVSELRAAISSDPRGMGYAPPKGVVLEFCRQACGCTIEGDYANCAAPPDPAVALSKAEMIQYKALLESGQLLIRQEFERECQIRGMNSHTFAAYLGRSPIVARYAAGVYGLRGANILPGEIEEVASREVRVSWVRDHGWTPDAQVWLVSQISPNTISSGVLYIPSAIRRLLEGRFVLYATDKVKIGNLVITKEACWGLTPFFTRRGGEAGDFLLLVFNPRTHEVVAQIGPSQESLTEFIPTNNQRVSVQCD